MKVDKTQLVVRFIEIGIQFDRATVRLNRLRMREALVGSPQHQTAGKVTLRQIGVYRERFIHSDFSILIRLLPLRTRRNITCFDRVGAGQLGIGRAKVWVSSYGLLE